MLNKPNDPNYLYTDGPFWQLPLRYPRILAYARKHVRGIPRTGRQKLADSLLLASVLAIYAVAAWWGAFWDLVLLWFVPFVLSKILMDWYINYLPHVALPPHRFHGTRIVDVPWLTYAVLAHNSHAIHHLWPTIPWHRYRATFREKLEYLREHGVPIETGVTQFRAVAGKPAGSDSVSG